MPSLQNATNEPLPLDLLVIPWREGLQIPDCPRTGFPETNRQSPRDLCSIVAILRGQSEAEGEEQYWNI